MRVALPPGYRTFENLQLELSEPPEGITLGEVETGAGRARSSSCRPTPAKSKAGFRGNLIVTVSGERVPARCAGRAAGRRADPAGRRMPPPLRPPRTHPAGQTAPPPPAAARRRITIGTLPAIAIEITSSR